MTDKTIAKTILEQLGGRMFTVMTGSKDYVARERGLSFRVGRNPRNVTFVRITLNGRDLYDVEFMRLRSNVLTTLSSASDIYAEDLTSVFEDSTGLCTSLTRRAA